jgi:YfiH family protein
LALGFPSLVYARQSHGDKILILRDQPNIDPSMPYPFHSVDGFVTRLTDLPVMVKVADCQAILLYEPNRRVAAATHTGWRGSVQNIVGKTVQLMEATFNCRPRDIIAAIGPSLGPCCAEFRNWRRELPARFARFRLGEDYFDFWAITRRQLLEAGLPDENIETAGLCTRCNPEVFYSYRGERQTGRFAAVIAIKGARFPH